MHTGVSPFRLRMRHAALALGCALVMSASLAGPTIKTGGTGSALHVTSALGDAFKQMRPETEVIVLTGLGRGGAIKPLYLVARANAAEPVHAWVAFIESPRGAAILAAHGYLALASTKR